MNAIQTEEIAGAPDVTRMHTAALALRRVVRGFVYAAAPDELGAAHAELRTTDRITTRWTQWGAQTLREPAEPAAGTLRVDLVADDVVRLRYVPDGRPVTDEPSPMIVGSLPAPTHPAVDRDGETVVLTTDAIDVRIDLKPVSVTITTPDGREVCRLASIHRSDGLIGRFEDGLGGRAVGVGARRMRSGGDHVVGALGASAVLPVR